MKRPAAFSAVAGVVALALSWPAEVPREAVSSVENNPTEPEARDGAALPGVFIGFILATYGVAGFVALAYQVFWTRTLVFQFEMMGSTTYAFSAMLTLFLIGLAVCSAVASLLIDRRRDPVRLYDLLQVCIGAAGILSLVLLTGDFFQPGPSSAGLLRTPPHWSSEVAKTFIHTAVIIGPATFLMGMTARICVRDGQSVGAMTGRLYAVNTLGAIVGSFAAGFVMIPVMGLSRGLLVLGMGAVINGAIVLVLNPLESAATRKGWAISALALLGGAFIALPSEYRFAASLGSGGSRRGERGRGSKTSIPFGDEIWRQIGRRPFHGECEQIDQA